MSDASLEGKTLAQALYDAGLAPPGTTRLEAMDGPFFYRADRGLWEPWRRIGDVWHLVLRFHLEICWIVEANGTPVAQIWPYPGPKFGIAATQADIPSAIAHLSLRLAAGSSTEPTCALPMQREENESCKKEKEREDEENIPDTRRT